MDKNNEYRLRDMHVGLLKMLSGFDTICKKNGIAYSLGFGSMLGAIRHHGIIPWDDDIDIIIDRENYGRLANAVGSSTLFVLEKDNTRTLWIPRFRLRNAADNVSGELMTIDMFLIDHVPDSPLLARVKQLMVLALQGMIKPHPDFKKGTALQNAATFMTYMVGRLFPLSTKFRLLEKVSCLGNKKSTKRCACYNVEYIYVGRCYNDCLLKEFVEMDFDGMLIPISRDYDSYLTTLYGDYMTPPSMQGRQRKHITKQTI